MVHIITLEEALQICNMLNQIPPEQSVALERQFATEQPVLYHFILDVMRKQTRECDGERIGSVALYMWQILQQGTGAQIRAVTDEELDRALQGVADRIVRLASIKDPVRKESATKQVVLTYPQPYVQAWLYLSLHTNHPPMDPDTHLSAIGNLQAMMDALVANMGPAEGQGKPAGAGKTGRGGKSGRGRRAGSRGRQTRN